MVTSTCSSSGYDDDDDDDADAVQDDDNDLGSGCASLAGGGDDEGDVVMVLHEDDDGRHGGDRDVEVPSPSRKVLSTPAPLKICCPQLFQNMPSEKTIRSPEVPKAL